MSKRDNLVLPQDMLESATKILKYCNSFDFKYNSVNELVNMESKKGDYP